MEAKNLESLRLLGLEIIKTAKKLRKNIPIISLSVSGRGEKLEKQLRALGVIEQLKKPIRPNRINSTC